MIDFFDFTNWHFYIAILLSVINAGVLCLEGNKFMQIIQLSGYHMRGYFDWLQNTRAKYFLRLLMLVLLSVAGIIVTNVIFRAFSEPYSDYLSYLGLTFYFLFSGIFIKILFKTPKKTPLKMTNRMKRSMALLYVVNLVISFGFILLSTMFLDIFRFGAVALTPLLLPLTVPFVHWVMMPMEKAINYGFVVRAKKKLKEYPSLIKIGITGSFGKTSVKNALATILEEKYSVCATPLNYNTPMGITKTVLENLVPINQILIAEMGARQSGDIMELCNIIEPQYGIVTSVGEQHMATFGSFDNVKRTKAELPKYLGKEGFCVFNIDNDAVQEMSKESECQKALISIKQNDVDVWATDIETTEEGTNFTLHLKGEEKSLKCKTKLLGVHNITNLLLCVPLASKLGLTSKQIVEGIKKVQPISHRLQLVYAPNDVLILDDTYNASIEGSQRALEVLQMFKNRRKIVITPGLVELGTIERLANYEFGERISKIADIVVIVNQTHFLSIKQGLLDAKFKEENIYQADTVVLAQDLLKKILKKGDIILWENDLPDNYT